MVNLVKGIFAAIIIVGLLVAFGSTFVLAFAQDAGSFTAAFIGMALTALAGLCYKAIDTRQA